MSYNMKPTEIARDKTHPLTNKYIVALAAITCAVLWGSAFPVLKISYTEMKLAPDDLSAKLILAGMRFFMASIFLFGAAVLSKVKYRLDKGVWVGVAVSGLLQITLQYFFFYNGLAHVTGMKGAILNSSGAFLVFILAHFAYTDDRLNWRKIIGLSTGLAGILLVNYGKKFTLDFSWQGEGFLIIAGLTSAFGTIMSKNISGKIHPLVLTAWQMLLGSVVLLLLGYPGLHPQDFVFTTTAWILLFYAAFLSAAAFSLWYSVLKYNKAGEISIYKFMIPVSGAVLSALFIPGEKLSQFMLAALLLVAVGIVVVNYKGRESGQP